MLPRGLARKECGEVIPMSPPNRAHDKLFDANLVYDGKVISRSLSLCIPKPTFRTTGAKGRYVEVSLQAKVYAIL